ncbi:unnamed protein product, partial [Diamesa hyperborea]
MFRQLFKSLISTSQFQIRKMSSSTNRKDQRIVWCDMEMTGLDINKDRVLELAIIITDSHLNVVANGPDLIINQSDAQLDSMNDWCKENLKDLAVLSKNSVISETQAEDTILEFLKQHIDENKCPLAGNTIYMDRMFLRKYFSRVDQYLSYRIIDVSSIKELCKRWDGKVFSNCPKKKLSHRALDDIVESIDELKYYKANFFK